MSLLNIMEEMFIQIIKLLWTILEVDLKLNFMGQNYTQLLMLGMELGMVKQKCQS